MRVIRKLIVLAFAAFGMYKVWELGSAKLVALRARASEAKARIEPTLRETEDTVQAAAEDVNASVHELSHTVVDAVAGDATGSSEPDASDTSAPLSSIPSRVDMRRGSPTRSS